MAGAPAKKGVDLALVFGGGGKGMPPRHSPMADDSATDGKPEPDEDDASGGAFDTAADEFMDDSAAPEDRKAALKRAIMACMGTDY